MYDIKIYPAEAEQIVSKDYINLYNIILKETLGMSNWRNYDSIYDFHIYPNSRIKMINNKLVYYLYKISGYTYYNEENKTKENEFKIKLKGQDFIATMGNFEDLNIVLSRNRESHLIKIEKEISFLNFEHHDPLLNNEINNWVLKGCPDKGFKYNTSILLKTSFPYTDGKGFISLTNIKYKNKHFPKKNIVLKFIGLANSFIKIIDKDTKEEWSFTSDYNYANVMFNGKLISSNNTYKTGNMKINDRSLFVTDELRVKALFLIEPIRQMLLK